LLAFMEVAARDPGLSVSSRAHLARAAREGERVRVILRQLLDFSRPARTEPRPVDLAQAAEEAAELVRVQRASRDIRLAVRRAPGAPAAHGDPGAVLQILLNLVLNAADAVGGTEAPAIALEVRPAALRARAGDGDAALALARAQADAVECVVADNGCGIAETDRERIFDPFFTTKPPGQGTGLGLSTAARLAEEMEGALVLVEPPPGFVTAFALRLPAAAAPVAEAGVRGA
jgi:signal transduction histidine kinase